LIIFLKGIEDPSMFGGRFDDVTTNFYRYQTTNPKTRIYTLKAMKAFSDLLTDCIFAYKQERGHQKNFLEVLIEQGKLSTRLNALHQGKIVLYSLQCTSFNASLFTSYILAWSKNEEYRLVESDDEAPDRKMIRIGLEKDIGRIRKATDPVTKFLQQLKSNSNLYDIKYQLTEKVSQ